MPPEQLLKATVFMALYSIRSERAMCPTEPSHVDKPAGDTGGSAAVRFVICDDAPLVREGIARLMGEMPEGLGYLLKERVANVGAIIDALERMRHGECVIDPTIIATLLSRRRPLGQLETLSAREYEVLQLMAEGLTNRSIAERLVVGERTVAGHVADVFAKFGLDDDFAGNRRVLAVLRFLQRR